MSAPVRLQKEVNMSVRDSIENFILDHAWFFLSLAIILGLLLFLTLCMAICGVSAVESGTQYRMEAWI